MMYSFYTFKRKGGHDETTTTTTTTATLIITKRPKNKRESVNGIVSKESLAVFIAMK